MMKLKSVIDRLFWPWSASSMRWQEDSPAVDPCKPPITLQLCVMFAGWYRPGHLYDCHNAGHLRCSLCQGNDTTNTEGWEHIAPFMKGERLLPELCESLLPQIGKCYISNRNSKSTLKAFRISMWWVNVI